VFERSGPNLKATLTVALVEALCGLSRVVLTTLDCRGLHMDHQKPNGGVLRPGQVLRVSGEGMPVKKSAEKGDLFLEVEVEFPDDKLLQDKNITKMLEQALPKHQKPIEAEETDPMEYDAQATLDEYNSWADEDWEDEEDGEGMKNAQCAQQ
jgi:DnaJ homolog subfamily A member 2